MGSCLNKIISRNNIAIEMELEIIQNIANNTTLHMASFITDRFESNSNSVLATGELIFNEKIGCNEFYSIYKGSYRGMPVCIRKIPLPSYSKKLNFYLKKIDESIIDQVDQIRCLRHPNIVLIMGTFNDKRSYNIITEYCSRGSLYDLLHRYNRKSIYNNNILKRDNMTYKSILPWNKMLKIALDIARALLYLHSEEPPIVHTKLTSHSILIDDSWNAKLIVRYITPFKIQLEHKKIVGYMAPELLLELNKKNSKKRKNFIKQKCDIYSFGIILFEMSFGDIPLHKHNDFEVIKTKLFQEEQNLVSWCISDLQEYNKEPNRWFSLIKSCLMYEASHRPTAEDIVWILEKLD